MKKRFVLFLIFLIVVAYLFSSIFLRKSAQKNIPSEPTPTPVVVSQQNMFLNSYKISPLEKTAILQTTDSQVTSSFTILSSVSSPSGIVTYSVNSVNPIVPDEIKTQNGKVIFEKTSTFSLSNGGLPSLQKIQNTFGLPEEVLTGNKYFGDFASSFLYPSKGFVIIGNPNNGEIYEVLHFTPMSHESFDTLYGSYVESLAPHKH